MPATPLSTNVALLSAQNKPGLALLALGRLSLGVAVVVLQQARKAARVTAGGLVVAAVGAVNTRAVGLLARARAVRADGAPAASASARARKAALGIVVVEQDAGSAAARIAIVVRQGSLHQLVRALGNRANTSRRAGLLAPLKTGAHKVVDRRAASTSNKVLAALVLGGRLGLELIQRGRVARLANRVLASTGLTGSIAGGHRGHGEGRRLGAGSLGRLLVGRDGELVLVAVGSRDGLLMTTTESVGARGRQGVDSSLDDGRLEAARRRVVPRVGLVGLGRGRGGHLQAGGADSRLLDTTVAVEVKLGSLVDELVGGLVECLLAGGRIVEGVLALLLGRSGRGHQGLELLEMLDLGSLLSTSLLEGQVLLLETLLLELLHLLLNVLLHLLLVNSRLVVLLRGGSLSLHTVTLGLELLGSRLQGLQLLLQLLLTLSQNLISVHELSVNIRVKLQGIIRRKLRTHRLFGRVLLLLLVSGDLGIV